MLWSYGVTTIPPRRELLKRTLDSLAAAGFDKPRLFVDGGGPVPGYECTCRDTPLGAWGNWYAALWELYCREPACERYVIFQDDVLAVKNLRAYLDSCRYPDGKDGRSPGFWNLVTMRGSEWKVVDLGIRCGWVEGAYVTGKVPNAQHLQQCSGALGLVFNRRAAGIVLGARSSVLKPISTDKPRNNIDGAVVTAMNLFRHDPETGERWEHGWREYVHGPSLLRHIGTESSIRNGKVWTTNAETWPGEEFDTMSMVRVNH